MPHCVRQGLSSPPPKAQHPNFRPLSIVAKWLDGFMPLGMEVGLDPGDFVLDGDPAHPKREQPTNSRPMSIVAKQQTAA